MASGRGDWQAPADISTETCVPEVEARFPPRALRPTPRMALCLEIAKIEMDIADSPDKQIRNPNAWVLLGFIFLFLVYIFNNRSNMC